MHGGRDRTLRRRQLDTISDDARAETACRLASKTRADLAVDRPGQVALERTHRQRGYGRSGLRGGDRFVELRLCLLQLRHVLRGKVAALIEILDHAITRGDRGLDRGARAGGVFL